MNAKVFAWHTNPTKDSQKVINSTLVVDIGGGSQKFNAEFAARLETVNSMHFHTTIFNGVRNYIVCMQLRKHYKRYYIIFFQISRAV